MHRLFITIFALIVALHLPAVAQNEQDTQDSPVGDGPLDRALLARLVVEETNRFRASEGRGPLVASTPLTAAAQTHARAMATEGFFAHVNPNDRSSRTLTDRIHNVGLEARACAENIALTYSLDFRDMRAWMQKGGRRSRGSSPAVLEYTYSALARSVVQQWIESPGHRRNLLGRPYSRIGLGFATSLDERGYKRVYCVQTFSAPI